MFDGKFRSTADAMSAPVGRVLVRWGVSADFLTAFGLVFAAATGVAIGSGHFWWAIILLTVSGLHDLLDGAVAKAGERSSQRGSFFDSVVDRLSDALLIMGVGWYLAYHGHARLLLLPFGLLITFFMISYQRSKAESLGIAAKGGLMERAERMVVLGVALLSPRIFVPVLVALLVLSFMTMCGRFWRVWQAAQSPEPRAPRSRR